MDARLQMRGVDEMQRGLEKLARRSVPFAARETLNSIAFEGRKIWQEEIRDAFTLRNRFTERRVLVEPTRTLDVKRMEATLGHTEPYMRRSEFGEPEKAAKTWRPVPTETAAGQPKGTLSAGRKKAVRAGNIITKLGNLRAKAGGGSRKAKNARAVRAALKSGKRLALLDFGRRKGIYRVMGSRKKPEIRKLYDLSRKVTARPRTPTLARTLARTLRAAPSIAHRALLRQLRRNHIAGY